MILSNLVGSIVPPIQHGSITRSNTYKLLMPLWLLIYVARRGCQTTISPGAHVVYVAGHWVSENLSATTSLCLPTNSAPRSSRGIGLEFVKQLVTDRSNTVFATCRSPDSSLALSSLKKESPNLHIVQLDVRDESSISAAAHALGDFLGLRGLDYLINNAGKIVSCQFNRLAPGD